jgi:hypothetical protein
VDICFYKKLASHKGCEVQFSIWDKKESRYFFSVNVDWSTRMDHAGFSFTVEIYRAYFSFRIYDSRHWNYKKEKWEVYKEKKK